MADNLTIQVTADTASLRAQMALAQADVRAYAAEVRKTANELRSAGDSAKAGIEAHLQRVAGQLNTASQAANKYSKEIKAALQPEGGGLSNMFKEAAESVSGLTAPLGAVKGAMMEIVEAAGIAFAIEKVGDWMAKTAEAGEKAVNLASAVGMSTQQYLEFAGAMRLSGGDAEEASRTLERLARNVGDALNNPSSRAVQAFKALGISMRDVSKTGGDATQMLRLIIGAANEFAPSMQRTEAVMALTGRGMNSLAGLLRGGIPAWDENIARTKALGAANADYAREQLNSAEKINVAKVALQGLSAELFHDLKPAFDDANKGAADFLNYLRLALKAANDLSKPIGGLSGVLRAAGKAFSEALLPGLGVIHGLQLLGVIPQLPSPPIETDPLEVTGEKKAPWMDKAGSGNQAYQAFAEKERLKIAKAQGAVDEIEAIYAEWLAEARRVYREESKQYLEVQLAKVNFEKEAQAKHFSVLETQASSDLAVGAKAVATFKSQMAEMVTERQITGEQAVGFEIQKNQQIYEKSSAALQQLYGLFNETPEQIEKINKLVEALNSSHLEQMAADNRDYAAQGKAWADAFVAPWKTAFDQIGSSLERAFNEAITRASTGKQILEQLRKSVESSFLTGVEGALSKAAAGPLARLLNQGETKPGEGVGDVLGNAFSGWISKGLSSLLPNIFGTGSEVTGDAAAATALGAMAAAATAATTALTAMAAAGGIATTATTGQALATATDTVATTADATAKGTSTLATIGDTLATYAETAAKWVEALFLEGGGIIPSAAGGWQVPSFAGGGILSILHPNEMVLPAHISQAVQNMAAARGGNGGGDFHAHFHGPMDAASLQKWFHSNKHSIANALGAARRGFNPNT